MNELLRTEFGLEDGLADNATCGEIAKSHQRIKTPEGVSADDASGERLSNAIKQTERAHVFHDTSPLSTVPS